MSSAIYPGRPPELDGGAPREVEIRYYAELLWRRRILLAAAAIGGLALGVLAGELQVPRFQARTLLQVMPPTPTSLNVTDALVQTGNPIRDRQFFNTQLNVLHSREIAGRVVEKLKLIDHWTVERKRREQAKKAEAAPGEKAGASARSGPAAAEGRAPAKAKPGRVPPKKP